MNFWNERYSIPEYVYGEVPNEYFKEKLAGLTVGKALFPADGEGRNGVYAATQGWDVQAFDLAEAGRKKAMALAEKHSTSIQYNVGEFSEFNFEPASFDLIVLIFAHFPSEVRPAYHRRLLEWLRPGGRIIFEAYSKAQITYQQKYNSGGPSNVSMLFSIQEIQDEFSELNFEELREEEVYLREGAFHEGLARVVRFSGFLPATR